MISVCLQGKPFNITVIQFYVTIIDAEEGEVDEFCEDILELAPKKKMSFKSQETRMQKEGSKEIPGVNGQIWPWGTK